MSVVYWDTMLFAFMFEGRPEFKSRGGCPENCVNVLR
jgi:hypothetical protein